MRCLMKEFKDIEIILEKKIYNVIIIFIILNNVIGVFFK